MKQMTVKIQQRFYALLNQTMDYLEVNPDVKRAGLARSKMSAVLAQYDQLLYEKRREAMQATLDPFFRKASAAGNEEPPTSDESPASDDP